MAVKAEYRQLGYVIGDIVEQMTKDGTIDEIFNRYRTVYEIPDFYAP